MAERDHYKHESDDEEDEEIDENVRQLFPSLVRANSQLLVLQGAKRCIALRDRC